MDTPQVTARDLDAALTELERSDATLGLAADGGWWAIGLHDADPSIFLGVPTSRDDTGVRQWARLRQRGLDVGWLPTFRDVDTASDVDVVAREALGSRFAHAAASMRVRRAS
jgi:glycosyltransferase A (GT-A) superfamily protein (DUF2064 family)